MEQRTIFPNATSPELFPSFKKRCALSVGSPHGSRKVELSLYIIDNYGGHRVAFSPSPRIPKVRMRI